MRKRTTRRRCRTAEWERLRRVVLDRDGWRCRTCGKAGVLEVDHIVPVHAGGSDDLDNLRALCRGCHIDRHRRQLTETEAAWLRHLDGFADRDRA